MGVPLTGQPDPHALDGWVLSTLPRALAFARGLLPDRDAAEDAVHDCYCRLLQKAAVYDLPKEGTKILFRSITNACIDIRRKRQPVSLFEDNGDGDAGRMMDLPDAQSAEPWQLAEVVELQQALSAALEKLPPAQRAAIELKSLGHSLQEIGDAIGTTANNAGVLIHRARSAIAREVAPRVET